MLIDVERNHQDVNQIGCAKAIDKLCGGKQRLSHRLPHVFPPHLAAGLLAYPHAPVLLPRATCPLPGSPGCDGEASPPLDGIQMDISYLNRLTCLQSTVRSWYNTPRSTPTKLFFPCYFPPRSNPAQLPFFPPLPSQGSGHQQMLGRMLEGGREAITVSEVDSFASRLNSVLTSDMSAVSAR